MSLDENSKRLFYERIDSNNINIFRTQNSLLFPVIYPESFYKNILSSWGTSAFLGTLLYSPIQLLNLVYLDGVCIGSFSTRIEALSRWNDIKLGKTVDNFSPSNPIGTSLLNLFRMSNLFR